VKVCYCDACRRSYRHDTGRELPRGALRSAEGRAYQQWRLALNTRILHELIDHIHSINPKLTVTHNGSGVRSWADWAFCDRDDYVSHEYHYSEGMDNLSLLCRQHHVLKPGVAFEIETWRFANRLGGARRTSRGYETRPPATLLTEMASVAAHGGFPQYYDQVRPDGTLDERSLKALQPAFGQLASRQRWGGVGEPLAYAAILWSKASEAFGGTMVQGKRSFRREPVRRLARHCPQRDSPGADRDAPAGASRLGA